MAVAHKDDRNVELAQQYRKALRRWAWNILEEAGRPAGIRPEDLVSAGLQGILQSADEIEADTASGEVAAVFQPLVLRAKVAARRDMRNELDRLMTGAVAQTRSPDGKRRRHRYSKAKPGKWFDDPRGSVSVRELTALERAIRHVGKQRGDWGPNAKFVDGVVTRVDFEAAAKTIPNDADGVKDRALIVLLWKIEQAPRNDPRFARYWNQYRSATEVVIAFASHETGMPQGEVRARLRRAQTFLAPLFKGKPQRSSYPRLRWKPERTRRTAS